MDANSFSTIQAMWITQMQIGIAFPMFSRIRKAAGTKPILVVVIPRPGDFLYLKQGKHFKLQQDLKSLIAKDPNSYMLDLLPIFAKAKDWKIHYQICDGHWTPLANIIAADNIRNHPFYKAF